MNELNPRERKQLKSFLWGLWLYFVLSLMLVAIFK